MSKKKVCKNCKMFVEGSECPNCKDNKFTNTWQGRIFIASPEKSHIAKKIGVTVKGEYAIKCR
ncbi:DNA-directed RNA polymerase subunit E'' [Candidatus Woesearchaeota archaeon]|nr:DNA-directed RNA polymerase subunit E'' [Candidatus Woesearchaeota archaeon]